MVTRLRTGNQGGTALPVQTSSHDQIVPLEVRDRWIADVSAEFERLRPLLPHIDPHDLHLILTSMLRPPEVPRHWLLRVNAGGGFVY